MFQFPLVLKLYRVSLLLLLSSLLPQLSLALATITPEVLTDPYDVLSYAANRSLEAFKPDAKELELKLAFERALLFAAQNPEWGPAVRLAVQTLKTAGSRAAYAASLPAQIQTALQRGDGVTLLTAIRRLHQTPGGDEILSALTQQKPGLDYDYLRDRLGDEYMSQQVINYLNQTLFGYT